MMKSLFVAAAMLFASQAGAATVTTGLDATLSGPVMVGKDYRFTYQVGQLPFDPTVYNAYSVTFTVNGLKYFPIVELTEGKQSPSNGLFGFYYNFLNPNKPTTLTVDAVIHGYVGASVTNVATFPAKSYVLASTGDATQMGTFVFKTTKLDLFGASAPAEQPLQQELRSVTAAVVPIGGTLPLMLTALGLGGWVLRSRGKAA